MQLNCQSLISAKSYHSLKCLSAHEGLVTHAQKVQMFRCSFSMAKRSFYKAANSILEDRKEGVWRSIFCSLYVPSACRCCSTG